VIDGSFDGPGGFPSLLPFNFCGQVVQTPCQAVALLSLGGGGLNAFKRQAVAALFNCGDFGCPANIQSLIQQGSAACANGTPFNFDGAASQLDTYNGSGDNIDPPNFHPPSASHPCR
jgi:hypothetical protein